MAMAIAFTSMIWYGCVLLFFPFGVVFEAIVRGSVLLIQVVISLQDSFYFLLIQNIILSKTSYDNPPRFQYLLFSFSTRPLR